MMEADMKFARRLTLALVFGLAGCGGGGSSGSTEAATSTPVTQPPASESTAVAATGVITGFSSVYVGGARYEVDEDTTVVDDNRETTGEDGGLRVGMKVRIRATEQDSIRTAERIEHENDLKGPVRDVATDALDSSIGTLGVLGQLVLVDANTVFDDDVGDSNGDGRVDIRDLMGHSDDLVVEVSGFATDGGFLATRLDRADPGADPGVVGDEYEIKGFVRAVAVDGSSFEIGDATVFVVDGAGGTLLEDGLAVDDSLLGRFVEVEVDVDEAGNLIGVNVEAEDVFEDLNDDGRVDRDDRVGRYEIEGILVRVNTDAQPHVIVVGGISLEVDDASALTERVGSFVEVKGTFNDEGVLITSRLELAVEHSVRTEDRVAAVDRDAGSFSTRLGLNISPTGMSRVEDDVEQNGDHLTPMQFIERLQQNDHVEARGFPEGGSVVWTRIERENEDELECSLRGPIAEIVGDDASDFEFVIEGVTIDVSQIVDDADFEGAGAQTLGRQAFFDALDIGALVKAESDEAGLGCEEGRLTAREVQFEADDGLVGTQPSGPADGVEQDQGNRELIGAPEEITENSFVIGAVTVTVVGATVIDDSLIEAALGREYDGGNRRFDQLPAGMTLPTLLGGAPVLSVVVDPANQALLIEDAD
jgi:hypothetical protein